MKNLLLTIFVIQSCLIIGLSQTIDLVQDLNPGPNSGYLEVACIQNDELHFIGRDEVPKYNEVFSLNSEGIIQKIAMSPDVDGAQIVLCTNQYTYIYNRGALSRDLYRHSSNSLKKIHSFNNNIEKSYEFENGVVFVEEDIDKNKTILYFDDNSDQAFTLLENVNLGFSDFDITQSNEYIILSPLNDTNYDGGVTIYNTISKQIDTTLLGNECEFVRYAIGFENHIVYSCEGEYFARNIITNQAVTLEINGVFPIRSFTFLKLYLETADYIFLAPQHEGDKFFSISKEDLSIALLSEDVGGGLDLFEKNDLVYFIESNSIVYHLFQTSGTIESRKEIKYSKTSFEISRGAYLNGKLHFIINNYDPGSHENVLARLNEDDEIEIIKQLFYESFNPLLERIGDKLIFGDNENDTGVELYALSYTDTNVSNINHSKIDLYPNPSNGYVSIPKLDSEIQDIIVVSTLGQCIPFEKIGNTDSYQELRINGEGLFQIIFKTSKSVYSSLVYVKKGQ